MTPEGRFQARLFYEFVPGMDMHLRNKYHTMVQACQQLVNVVDTGRMGTIKIDRNFCMFSIGSICEEILAALTNKRFFVDLFVLE